MSSGIEMLLKSFGVDPNEIKTQMESTIDLLKNGITELQKQQSDTNEKLEEILDILKKNDFKVFSISNIKSLNN